MAIAYDRRVPDALLDALAPGGFAHSLVQYGRSGALALDLQLRGYAGKNGHWATLYVGLTKVLDLNYLPGKGFRLGAHPTYRTDQNGWHTTWEKRHDDAWWTQRWGEVEDYLETVIVTVGHRHLKEGAVQSAICGFDSPDRVIIDREASVTFGSASERISKTQAIAAPLLTALHRPGAPAWWKSHPTSLGGECDALAIDSAGRVLTIEIKPSDASTLPWALVQVMHYANLFRAWTTEQPHASQVLNGMLRQRRSLGLTLGGATFGATSPLTVRPVLAFDRRASHTARARLKEVHDHLTGSGIVVDVDLYEANRVGRLDPYDL